MHDQYFCKRHLEVFLKALALYTLHLLLEGYASGAYIWIMMTNKKPVFGFKRSCITVGICNILLASSIFIKGVMNNMAQFNVPPHLLTSPYYEDAMSWVFLHMFMIGVLLIMIGILAENPTKKLWVARGLVVIHCVYAYLDMRSSDNYFGNALYQGVGSVIPLFIDLVYIGIFLRLSIAQEKSTDIKA